MNRQEIINRLKEDIDAQLKMDNGCGAQPMEEAVKLIEKYYQSLRDIAGFSSDLNRDGLMKGELCPKHRFCILEARRALGISEQESYIEGINRLAEEDECIF